MSGILLVAAHIHTFMYADPFLAASLRDSSSGAPVLVKSTFPREKFVLAPVSAAKTHS